MNFTVPTIEEIYDEFHRQKLHATKGVYSRPLKNFDKLLADPAKREYLVRFQNMIRRNLAAMDWRIYVRACAELLKHRFDLKVLGSVTGNKLYREYLNCRMLSEDTEENICAEIVRSLKFVQDYSKADGMSFEEYFDVGGQAIPLALNHLYSGTVSIYLYAALPRNYVWARMTAYGDDVFEELFEKSKNEFFETILAPKREAIVRFPKAYGLVLKLERKFG